MTHVTVPAGLLVALAGSARALGELYLQRLKASPHDAVLAAAYDEVRSEADQAYILAGLPSAAGYLPSLADLRASLRPELSR